MEIPEGRRYAYALGRLAHTVLTEEGSAAKAQTVGMGKTQLLQESTAPLPVVAEGAAQKLWSSLRAPGSGAGWDAAGRIQKASLLAELAMGLYADDRSMALRGAEALRRTEFEGFVPAEVISALSDRSALPANRDERYVVGGLDLSAVASGRIAPPQPFAGLALQRRAVAQGILLAVRSPDIDRDREASDFAALREQASRVLGFELSPHVVVPDASILGYLGLAASYLRDISLEAPKREGLIVGSVLDRFIPRESDKHDRLQMAFDQVDNLRALAGVYTTFGRDSQEVGLFHDMLAQTTPSDSRDDRFVSHLLPHALNELQKRADWTPLEKRMMLHLLRGAQIEDGTNPGFSKFQEVVGKHADFGAAFEELRASMGSMARFPGWLGWQAPGETHLPV